MPADGGSFADRYRAVVADRGRLCAGIDPHPELLEAWGLPVDGGGVRAFGDICVEAFAGSVAVIKPQVAFFETFGSAGFAALESVISGCQAGGALVIADGKRGDIGSTMTAYARAWLDPASALCADALTVSPYLGFGSLSPAIALARAGGRAVFALARTSNPEGESLQLAQTGAGTVAQSIVDAAAAENSDGHATVGLVVGATRHHGLQLADLGAPILAPGLGAQGAAAGDLPAVFADADQRWVLPAASRSVLRHGSDVTALRDAARRTRDEIEAAFGGGF